MPGFRTAWEEKHRAELLRRRSHGIPIDPPAGRAAVAASDPREKGCGVLVINQFWRAHWTKRAAVLWLIGWAIFSLPVTDFRPSPRFRRVNLIPFHGARPGDAARNLLYYVPAGVIGLLLGLAVGPVVAAAAGLSVIAETTQLFAGHRFPSATDITLNTAGAALGALYWSERRRRRASTAAARTPGA